MAAARTTPTKKERAGALKTESVTKFGLYDASETRRVFDPKRKEYVNKPVTGEPTHEDVTAKQDPLLKDYIHLTYECEDEYRIHKADVAALAKLFPVSK